MGIKNKVIAAVASGMLLAGGVALPANAVAVGANDAAQAAAAERREARQADGDQRRAAAAEKRAAAQAAAEQRRNG